MTSATPTMGWLRLVGSLKLQVSFAEYSLFYRALLQKRPILLRSLLIVATPYQELTTPLLNFTKRGPILLKRGPTTSKQLTISTPSTGKKIKGLFCKIESLS